MPRPKRIGPYKIPIEERIKIREDRSDERFFYASLVMIFEKNARQFDIARQLELSPGTMCKIVAAWKDEGLVGVDKSRRNYRLTRVGFIKLQELAEERFGKATEQEEMEEDE